MTIGQRMKALRKERRWTLKEVANKLGLSGHSTYSNWEYGRTEPDIDMIKKIAEIYDVEVKYLLTGESSPEIDPNYDLEELLRDKNLKWGNKELTQEEKEQAIKILNIILNNNKDT